MSAQHLATALPAPERRRLSLSLATALLLCGCGTVSPPALLHRLPVAAPVDEDGAAPPAARPGSGRAIWELAPVVVLPAYLEREALLVAGGDSTLQALAGHRWAEPLRDSLPRLLRHDLALLRGADRIWMAPAPVAVGRRLQLELLALHADVQRRVFNLQAHWWLTDPGGQARAVQDSVELKLPLSGADAESIVMAHRLGLWQLAGHIASGQP